MTVRLKGGNQVVEGGLRTLAETKRELSRLAEKELQAEAPVDTGELRNSIRRGRGKVIVAFTALHGVVQNARGKHRGWIDKAMRRAIRTFEGG